MFYGEMLRYKQRNLYFSNVAKTVAVKY